MTGSAAGELSAAPVTGAPRCELAESPRWDGDRWWWVDAPAGLVYAATTRHGAWTVTRQLSAGCRTSMVHPAGPEKAAVARGTDLHLLQRRLPGRLGRQLARLTVPDGWLLNDGAADAQGGLWIGVVHPDRTARSGYLQRLSPSGVPDGRIDGVTLSNGIAFDPTGELMYHADSLERTVTAYRLDGRGRVCGSEPFVRWPAGTGLPDGLATDLDGGLWVAAYGAGEVRRYCRTGQPDLVIAVPTPQVTSVAIGGPDGSDVLITTAREGYDRARSVAEPLAGRLFHARSPYRGRPAFDVLIAGGTTGPGQPDRPSTSADTQRSEDHGQVAIGPSTGAARGDCPDWGGKAVDHQHIDR